MAQSATSPFTDNPANSLLDDIPDTWEIERANEADGRDANEVRRELLLGYGDGAAIFIKGSTVRGFTTYYREPGEDVFGTVLKSRLWGRRCIRSFQQCIDRAVVLASQHDDTHDADDSK